MKARKVFHALMSSKGYTDADLAMTGDKVTLIPRYFIARPADLEALGLTVDEVAKMIKEQNT